MLHKMSMLLFLTLSACSTSQHKQTTYNGQLEIYPAVINVFEQMHARVQKIDVLSNVYISERVYNKKLNIKYNIKVTYKNKLIHASLLDVKQPHAYHKTMWVPYNSFFPLDDSKIRNSIEAEILAILNDSDNYTKIKNDILSEIGFHYLVAKNMSRAESDKWIEKNMIGKKFILNLTNYDPEFRINDTNTAPNKKYIAHFRYNSQKWVSMEFDLDLYTNNAFYGNMPINTKITTLANFIKAKIQIYIVTFGFSFEQLLPET
ncbi:MAG: hypothetical protein ACC653_12515 [Gammaproteobacteria bacterium]